MSYISSLKRQDKILVWERVDGKRNLKTYDAPYYFYTKAEKNDIKGDNKYISMFEEPLIRHDFSNGREFYEAKSVCKNNGIKMFESDIPPDLKLLSKEYYQKDPPSLHITFYDIEVDYNPEIGHASVENPYAPVNSIALYHKWSNTMIVIAVPPEDSEWSEEQLITEMKNGKCPLPDDINIKVTLKLNEVGLLKEFLKEIEDSDAIIGWYSNFFDTPYIGKRLERLGKKYFDRLSFDGANPPKYRSVEQYGKENWTLDISGRIAADYLELYKKFEQYKKPSYKLSSIADEVLPDLPKLQYEGSLADLYRKDFAFFVRYNFRDTEILKGFEEKLGYVELANGMCHEATGQFNHVTGTLKIAELSLINYCHYEENKNIIVNDNEMHVLDKKIKGALVTLPQVGMFDNSAAIDIRSLYPFSMISVNISPETLFGQFFEEEKAFEEIKKRSDTLLTLKTEDGATQELKASEWRTVLSENNYSVSGFGTVFSQHKVGIIPNILLRWFSLRAEYQKMKKQAIEDGNDDKAKYYDRLQYIYKIKLNSLYGALSNPFFRFFNVNAAESTTGTGRAILRHQCAEVVKILDGEYLLPLPMERMKGKEVEHGEGYTSEYSAIYSDTDSVYFKTHAKDKDEAIIIADRVSELVNASFKPFMQDSFLCNPGYDDYIQCEREIISDRGIYIDKKRYILHLTDVDGESVDKLKVMGIDTKRTTMPPPVAKKLNSFIDRLLKKDDWEVIKKDIVDYKEELLHPTNIMSIGLPKGINNLEMYTASFLKDPKNTKLPGHVAAAIHWNKQLAERNDKVSIPIMSGMNIKVFYLTKKVGIFKSIAIPVDIEEVPAWFLEEFTVDAKAHMERLVDKPLNNILKAIGEETPTKQSLLTDFLFQF